MKEFNKKSILFVIFTAFMILVNPSYKVYGNSKVEKKDKEGCIIEKDGSACFKLGTTFSERNPVMGRKWYKLGCKAGHSESCAEFEKLKNSRVGQQDQDFDRNMEDNIHRILTGAETISNDKEQETQQKTADKINYIFDETGKMTDGKSIEEMERINELLDEERIRAEQKSRQHKKRLEDMMFQDLDNPPDRKQANEMIEKMKNEYRESYGEDL